MINPTNIRLQVPAIINQLVQHATTSIDDLEAVNHPAGYAVVTTDYWFNPLRSCLWESVIAGTRGQGITCQGSLRREFGESPKK